MKTVVGPVAALGIVGWVVSGALANPALLPKHEGYPAKPATSPVTGQPLAYDPGQTNLGGEQALVKSVDATDNHVEQNLVDTNNARIAEKQGAGRLPKVQGPQIKIEPPVSSATKVSSDRKIE
jgi:hypothetical protein